MGKIKKSAAKEKSVLRSLVIYTGIFIIAAVALACVIFELCEQFSPMVEVYFINSAEEALEASQGKELISIFMNYDNIGSGAAQEFVGFIIKNAALLLIVVFCFALCVFFSSLFFYYKKLSKPLKILNDAAENILNENLDFEIKYDADDEMGRLCKSFELMRKSLEENNRELWSIIDEQKRVQNAFVHDVRTPLTVILGYTDFLEEYVPTGEISEEKLMDTISLIRQNVMRLDDFSSKMHSLQRISDMELSPTQTAAEEFFTSAEESCRMISREKKLNFSSSSDSEYIFIDSGSTREVIYNLVSNAARFAKSEIDCEITVRDGVFTLEVRDDGDGFSPSALKHCFDVYYSESKGNFGLGLNICKIICEKAGGNIKAFNTDSGAAVKASFPVKKA